MAAPKKTTSKGTAVKSTAKKNTGSKSGTKPAAKTQAKNKKPTEEPRFGDSVLDEILLILIIVFCAFVLVSLFSASTGVVGKGISLVLKGILGFGAYILPILVVCYCLWLLLSKERYFMGLKITGGVLVLLSVSALAHIISGTALVKAVATLFQAGAGSNGGVIGGLISYFLLQGLGKLGTYLVLIAILVVAIIMISGLSLFRGIGDLFTMAGDHKRRKNVRIQQRAERIRMEEEVRERRRVEREAKEAEKEEKRAKHKSMFNVVVGEEKELPESQALPENSASFMKRVEQENLEREREELAALARRREEEQNKGPIVVGEEDDKENFEDIPVIMLRSAYEEEETPQETAPVSGGVTLEAELETPVSGEGIEVSGDLRAVTVRTAPGTSTTPANNVRTLPPAGGDKGTAARVDIAMRDDMRPYTFPPMNLLGKAVESQSSGSKTEMLANAKKLEETLKSFGVDAKVIQINKGPTVTRYELTPSQGVKVSKIVNLADDIALNLAASGIRIEAPIPGKAAVGIEVPNKESQSVYLREVLESEAFQKFPSKLAFALGEDIAGNPVVTDIAKMPHLLIAGATGSGKSVCINTLITSILYKAKPDEVKLLMIDPKVVELSVYNGIPHLLLPVVTDPKKAAGTLNWAVREMLQRYNDFFAYNVRDIAGYNAQKKERGEDDFMPQIVIIIDELADLMMAAPKEVEDSICRLAQMARAAGIHLIIATQRPSVDVITGLIKANIPSRLAFAVSSGVDSRTILDMVGAEKLLGKGDMLFYPVGKSKPVRIQGAFVTDKEVEHLVDFVKGGNETVYDADLVEKITSAAKPGVGMGGANDTSGGDDNSDEFLEQAMELVVSKEKASVSMLQRQFRIGFNRASRLMDELEAAGVVGPEEGSKPRKVKMNLAEFEHYKAGKNRDES